MDKVRWILGIPLLLEGDSDIEHSSPITADFHRVFEGYRSLRVEGRVYDYPWRNVDRGEFAGYSL